MDLDVQEITQYASIVLAFFLIGYILIIVEEFTQLNKAAAALLMAVGCWTVLFLEPAESVERHLYILTLQMFKVSQVVFFLLGALAIVETINAHRGFEIITKRLVMRSKRKLLWATGFVTFFLSSVLDNLTTTIVMLSMINKLSDDRQDRLILGGATVIAANVGGAWTPIGDVSTTLLWIYGRISTLGVMRDLFLPSILGLVACLLWLGFNFKGEIKKDLTLAYKETKSIPGSTFILIAGVLALVFVPVFRLLTDLPPFMGMILGLGIMWLITDLMHSRFAERHYLRVNAALAKVDVSVILFYLGVLLSINALETAGLLKNLATWVDTHFTAKNFIPLFVGIVSSIVDNVSLVAATLGMYDLKSFPLDSTFWQAITYTAGTGGSIFIVGSAAGVAFMAIEKVGFTWYAKKMAIPALLTFFVGYFSYMLLGPITQALYVD